MAPPDHETDCINLEGAVISVRNAVTVAVTTVGRASYPPKDAAREQEDHFKARRHTNAPRWLCMVP